jgi:phytoene/squalene synthetase
MRNNKPESTFQIALLLSPEEADALWSLLLCAPETDDVSEEMTAHLLRRLMEAQRAHREPCGVELPHEASCV